MINRYSSLVLVCFVLALAWTRCAAVNQVTTQVSVKLNQWHLRNVPVAQQRSEEMLVQLIAEEKQLSKQIAELERKIKSVSHRESSRNSISVDIQKDESESGAQLIENNPMLARELAKAAELTQSRMAEWETDLKNKKQELSEVIEEIEKAKAIAKDPDGFIVIPVYTGEKSPEEVQARERELLTIDRENMLYRQKIQAGQLLPDWLADQW